MKLKGISSEVKEAAPVFIVGAPRSGTSILYRTLQQHPTFRPKTMNLAEEYVFSNCSRSWLFGAEFSLDRKCLRYMLRNRGLYERFLDSIRWIQVVQSIINSEAFLERFIRKFLARSDLMTGLWWHLCLGHIVARSFFYYAKEARGVARLVGKNPKNYRFVREIQWTFSNAKMLYIYRHPVDVFSSYRRRLTDELDRGQTIEEVAWLNISPADFCEEYRKSIDTILKARASLRQSILLVRYERFVRKPADEFRRVCSFLGEAFDSDALTIENPDLSRWKPDPHLFGQIVSKTKRWEQYISCESARFVEAHLEATMRALDYNSYTDCW